MAIFSNPKSKKEYAEDEANDLRVRASKLEGQQTDDPKQREANLQEAKRLRDLANKQQEKAKAYSDEYGV